MFAQNELYTLNADRMLSDETSIKGTKYQGQLVLGGPDAAIEMRGEEIRLSMHGAPTENPAFTRFVAGYRDALIKTAQELSDGAGSILIIAGKWHHVEFHCEPFFAPYVIHLISSDGAVRSQPYDIEIFDTDDNQEGRDTSIVLGGVEESETIEWLRRATADILWRFGSTASSSGHSMFAGMLWRSSDDSRSAVYINFTAEYAKLEQSELESGEFASVFTHLRDQLDIAIEQNTLVDGLQRAIDGFLAATASASEEDRIRALARMLEIFSQSPIGISNGKPIFRTEMPIGDTVTIEAIANSTTATGFWLQMRETKGEFSDATFYLFNERHRIGDQDASVLYRRTDTSDESLIGCIYASDWEYEGGGYEFRRLALGPVPKLSW